MFSVLQRGCFKPMKFLSSLALRTKFLLLPLLTAGLVMVLGASYLTMQASEKVLLNQTVSQDIPKMREMFRSFSAFSVNHAELIGLLASSLKNKTSEAQIYAQGRKSVVAVNQTIDELNRLHNSFKFNPDQQQAFDRLQQRLIDYRHQVGSVVLLASVEVNAIIQFTEAVNEDYRATNDEFLHLLAAMQRGTQFGVSSFQALSSMHAAWFIFMLGITILFATLSSLLLSRLFSSDLKSVVTVLAQLTRGDTNIAQQNLNRHDEFGIIHHAITLHSIGDAVIATDRNGLVTRMNRTAERLTGWTFAQAQGLPLEQVFRIVNVHTRVAVENPVQRVLAEGKTIGLANHTALIARDGKEYQVSDSAAPICNQAGQIEEVVLVFNDVTAQYKVQEALRISEQRLRTIIENEPECVKVVGRDGELLEMNAAGLAMLEVETLEQVRQYGLINFVNPGYREAFNAVHQRVMNGEHARLEFEVTGLRGTQRWLETHAAPIRDDNGNVATLLGIIRDITDRKRAERQIHQLAFYDPLTDLPNRRLLLDRMQQARVTTTRHENHGAILFIDLDNFKTLNDTKGHHIGDLLLIEVAKRLQEGVRGNDTVVRLGGDEFVIMLGDLNEDTQQAAAQARDIADKVLISLSQPFNLNGLEHHSTASIGITLFQGDKLSMDDLLKHADAAMYQSKTAGRNTLRFFDPVMQATLETRALLEADLRQALAKQQLRLYYQPQVNSKNKVIGAEVLLRWQHPVHGLIAPLEFISIAEETGLIIPIGLWVLHMACAQLKIWRADPLTRHLQLAVNVSARQFRQADFVDQVLQATRTYGIDPLKLKLELTESLVLDDISRTIEKMETLGEAGVYFSMDDFGIGQSSLTHLKRLPLEQIKIDQSFVRDINADTDDAAIVRTIIGMANNLELEVIAEGVETMQQRDFLEQNGCHLYQGYLFGKPVPIEGLKV